MKRQCRWLQTIMCMMKTHFGQLADILERLEYQGHTVNFKTYRQSYKSKRTLQNPADKSKGYREQQIDISYDLVGILPAALLNGLQNGETA